MDRHCLTFVRETGMLKFMTRLLLIFAMASLTVFGADKSVDAIKAAEKAWAEATVKGDAAALGKLLADDLTYTHSTGDVDTKAVFIGNLSGARKYHKIDFESIEARLYGNAAVSTCMAQIATSMKGGAVNPAHLKMLHLWVLQKGEWRLAAHQSLRLPK